MFLTEQNRSDRSQRAYHSGVSAENAVERYYLDHGLETAARRWRRQGVGELDLVMRDGKTLVFVEVKKSRDFARAAESLTARQMMRLADGAAAYLAGEPRGEMTECRFDVALVNAQGEIHILENALSG
ncbi:YraN family protein [uncultured Shimia sp.]|uniref:YraN family protein n=1 Tax=uncultured Shimia sp. TaxID=573152 RepID=UPI00260F684D|nr:YraN family protein [uncultured Shimia sp.]